MLLAAGGEAPDISSVPPDLEVPMMTDQALGAGRRVRQTTPGYEKTAVYHALYLPRDWAAGKRFPVIVEFAGNGNYRSKYGDVSAGQVEGSKLGYGVSGGEGFIWVCMPYLNSSGTSNVITWWGDKPDYRAGPTVDYCKKTVRFICEQYGGDPEAVILAGFSRGAIACNFIGLYDDEIARLWLAFIPYSHYDGVLQTWPYPGRDRMAALERLKRLKGRAQFICQEGEAGALPAAVSPASGSSAATSSVAASSAVSATRRYIESTGVKAPFTFMPTGFRNHNDAWTLRPSPARDALRQWLRQVLKDRPGLERR